VCAYGKNPEVGSQKRPKSRGICGRKAGKGKIRTSCDFEREEEEQSSSVLFITFWLWGISGKKEIAAEYSPVGRQDLSF